MKNSSVINLLFVALLLAAGSMISCNKTDDVPDPVVTLTADEISNLEFMREEEKLARDVYLHFNDIYDLKIFKNISNSEQTHMDKVLELLEKYDIADPASTEMGVFNNANIQTLYNTLSEQGEQSLIDALTVGATIEDVDIRDLNLSIDATDKTDLIGVYEMLKCGSSNHMRGFTSQLTANGGDYTPQYISQELYDEILAGEHEHCGQ